MDIRKFFNPSNVKKTNASEPNTQNNNTKDVSDKNSKNVNQSLKKVSNAIAKVEIEKKNKDESKDISDKNGKKGNQSDKKESKAKLENEKHNKDDSKDITDKNSKIVNQSAKKESKAEVENEKKKKDSTPKSKKTSIEKSKTVKNDEIFINDDDSDDEYISSTPVVKKSSKKVKKDPFANLSKQIETIEDSEEEEIVKKELLRNSKQISSDDDGDEELQHKKRKKKNKKKEKNKHVIDSDSEEDEKLQKVPKSRKKKEYISDSEDELRPTIRNAFSKVKEKHSTKSSDEKIFEESAIKAVTLNDFFGEGHISRSSKTTPVSKKIESHSSKQNNGKHVVEQDVIDDFDDDEAFERTLDLIDLEELDMIEEKPKPNDNKVKSIAQKLAMRAKNSCYVEETPDKSSNQSNSTKKSSPLKRSLTPDEKAGVLDEAHCNIGENIVSVKSQSPPKKKLKMNDSEESDKSAKGTVDPLKKSLFGDQPSKILDEENDKSEKVTVGSPLPLNKSISLEKNLDESLNSSFKKAGYVSYLTREGPQSLGSKELPVGAENCLEGLTFVVTGILESIERDEAKSLIEKHGGKVTQSVSKKTSYVVVGRDAGPGKLAKVEQFKLKTLDEDSLFDLIRNQPGKKSKYVKAAEETILKEKEEQSLKKKPSLVDESCSKAKSSSSKDVDKSSSSKDVDKSSSSKDINKSSPSKDIDKSLSSKDIDKTSSSKDVDKSSSSSSNLSSNKNSSVDVKSTKPVLLWVDKYKPTTMKQIIGQQGDKSCAKKLFNWLKSWQKNRILNAKPTMNRFNDDGSGHKAALLSGSPGVGKTTTATIVCQEAGFSFVELNASDTRSKKSMENTVAEMLGNHSLDSVFGLKAEGMKSHNHCLIMDEVDGMSGNDDRGGMAELINLIKKSKIPIICMCNDRNHSKIRSLANYCFDLRFQKPRVEQIKAAMMTVAYKEGLKIAPPALNEIILGSNQDVRQVLHNLALWSADNKELDYESCKKESQKAKKDIKIGPFDAIRKVFEECDKSKDLLFEKTGLFFSDYSIMPLFVQENYIHINPFKARGDKDHHMKLIANAAQSIAIGDLVEKKIRSNQSWNLLPLQAVFACVIPGEEMKGSLSQMASFPSWLGKHSTTSKNDRLLQELRFHMSLNISSDKRSLNMDYIPHLRKKLTDPLVTNEPEAVAEVVKRMQEYDLTRDDFDSIIDLSSWPGMVNPMKDVETKTKAAFTRTFNKECHLMPYAAVIGAKKSKPVKLDSEMDEDNDAAEEDDADNDPIIKAIKKKPNAKSQNKKTDNSKKAKDSKGASKSKSKSKS